MLKDSNKGIGAQNEVRMLNLKIRNCLFIKFEDYRIIGIA